MSNTATTADFESRTDYKDTPQGQYEYWTDEITASQDMLKDFQKQGDKIVRRFIDKRKGDGSGSSDNDQDTVFRLNLFHSNITTLTSMLYGNLPTVDVSRRYADANDDVARVAAEVMERLLNNDISDNGESYNAVLRGTLQDRLLAGLGVARVRYSVEMGEENGEEVMQSEDAPIDYYFWRDVLYSWGRSFSELRWIGFRSFLTKDEVHERFGEWAAENVQLKKQGTQGKEDQTDSKSMQDSWLKAEIWEIWDKDKRQVVWVSVGCDRTLDSKDDPLELSNFYPCPPFFVANPTSTLYVPTADYHMAQDLYREIDILQSRISVITEAVKVVGVYDKGNEDIGRMFSSGDNTLIPVDNWALFSEKGGLRGVVEWVPIADIVNTLDKLTVLRDQTIGLLHQVTGMSDVLRGGGGQYEGVGQAQLKAKLGSVRIQALQDEFATFASGLLQLKAEVISKHFSPETIAMRSNMGSSFDAKLLPEAIDLIKNPKAAKLRVVIRPESVAMVDYAQLKQERSDYITALATFMQSAAPLVQMDKSATPFLLQLLQWGLAGFKGASEIEGVIDQAIEKAQESVKNQSEGPSPEEQAAQMEKQKMQAQMQMEMQKLKASTDAEILKINTKARADMQVRQHDLDSDIKERQAEMVSELTKVKAELAAHVEEIMAKMQADIMKDQELSQANVHQQIARTQSEVEKKAIETQLDIQKIAVETQLQTEADIAKQGAIETQNRQTD